MSPAPVVSGGELPIALVSAYFWPERLGCAPYLTDLALHFAQEGRAVHVFTAAPHYPRKSGIRIGEDSPDGVTVTRAHVLDRSAGGLGVRLLNDVAFALQAAASLALRRRWDAILLLAPTVLSVPAVRLVQPRGRLLAAVLDVESRLAATTGLAGRGAAGLFDAIQAWCLNRADAVVTLTPQMRDALRDIGVRRPIEVVPIWPLVEAPAPAWAAAGRPPTLMYSGGIGRRHGVHLLPGLWRALRPRLPGCRLVIQGDGTERDAVMRQIHAAGGDVVGRPAVERQALAASLAEADLQLVLQSEAAAAYSMPSKALTCLAAGVPFLTNSPAGSALAELAAASGGGRVVPSGSGEALAEAAAELLAAPPKLQEMAGRGMAYARLRCDRSTLLRRYSAALAALPRRRQGARPAAAGGNGR